MASTFAALPIPSGESFLLITDQDDDTWSILVDSGWRKDGSILADAIHSVAPDLRHIDVAICTHQDADHTTGFPDFFDQWVDAGHTIDQVWLPRRWSRDVRQLMLDPDGYMSRLANGASLAARDLIERLTAPETALLADTDEVRVVAQVPDPRRVLQDAARAHLDRRSVSARREVNAEIAAEPMERSRSGQVADSLGLSPDELEALQERLELAPATTLFERYELLRSKLGLVLLYYGTEAHVQHVLRTDTLLGEASQIVSSIKAIFDSAARNRIPIHWFDYDAYDRTKSPRGGIAGVIEPVNSVEERRPDPERLDDLALFYSVMLSPQNVESLVFQRVESGSEPSVFFLGDSRLATGESRPDEDFRQPAKLPRRPPIVTAPHHASGHNDHAYVVLNNWLGEALFRNAMFARNGGQSNQTLKEYLKLPQRRCAQCVQCNGKTWNQPVVFKTNGRDWIWPPAGASICGKPRKKSKKQ